MVVPDWSTPWKSTPLGTLKRLACEFYLHLLRWFQIGKTPRIIVFPCGNYKSNPASLLRAYSIGYYLKTKRGWRVTIVPPEFSFAQRKRIIKHEKPDLIIMQMERHPLNRPRMYYPYPVVFDIDDADFVWPHARDLVIECCRDSVAVVAGSKFVADYASQHNSNVKIIWTGYAAENIKINTSQIDRKMIVAWGHSRPYDYIDEANFIQDILVQVNKRVPLEYWLYGLKDDDNYLQLAGRLVEAGIAVKTHRTMSFDSFTNSLESVAVGLQVLSANNEYSQGKSFGKILNYVCAGVVVVASRGADHAEFIHDGRNGYLADSVQEWVDILTSLLLDKNKRELLSRQALVDFESKLSIRAAGDKYDYYLKEIKCKYSGSHL